MNAKDIKDWATTYVRAQLVKGLNYDHPDWWAVEKFMYIGEKGTSAQDCLEAILAVLDLDPPDKVISVLAAGPLEDLIHGCGEEVINDIECLSQQRPDFRDLLGGVWECGSPEIWSRVIECRRNTW